MEKQVGAASALPVQTGKERRKGRGAPKNYVFY
jgi:hypothetical protein